MYPQAGVTPLTLIDVEDLLRIVAFLSVSSRGSRTATSSASPWRLNVVVVFGVTVPDGEIEVIGPVSKTLTGMETGPGVHPRRFPPKGQAMETEMFFVPRAALSDASRMIVDCLKSVRAIFLPDTPPFALTALMKSIHGPVIRIFRDDLCAMVTRCTGAHSTVRVFCSRPVKAGDSNTDPDEMKARLPTAMFEMKCFILAPYQIVIGVSGVP
jgi:hypothetical protein